MDTRHPSLPERSSNLSSLIDDASLYLQKKDTMVRSNSRIGILCRLCSANVLATVLNEKEKRAQKSGSATKLNKWLNHKVLFCLSEPEKSFSMNAF